MKARTWLNLSMTWSLALAILAQGPNKGKGLTPSAHRAGPHGLEGWTLDGPIPDQPNEKFPFTLVIARNGKTVRRIDGDPFLWRWVFVADGRQVAYQTGPLHFSLTCILADTETGRQLETFDCYHESAANGPGWVQDLEARQ